MLSLALAYLRDRALTTLLNILLLGLAVATLVLLLLFSTQIGNRFERDAAGVELVVGAKGSPLQLILSSLYQIDAPTGNVPLETVTMLRRNPSVALAVPLALGDSFRGFRIVGTEPAYLDLYQARLARGAIFAAPGEAVIGAEVARRTGMDLGQQFLGSHGLSSDGAGEHDQAPFMAVGILEPTGSVIDRLIIVSVESVWDAHGIAHGNTDEAHDEVGHSDQGQTAEQAGHEIQPEVTAILVKYRNAFGAVRLPGMINRQTDMQAAVPAIETARLLSLLGSGIEGARLFAWLLALTGGLSIFVALLQAASSREGELALLRVMGASRLQVFGTILIEGLLTAAAGCVLGLVTGHLALAAAVASFDRLREIGIDPWSPHVGELVIVAAVLAIGVVAALIPALRVFRTDLALTLSRAR
jgi:putative ABC transport system permease protein